MVIGERLATLKELETYYSYNDLLDLAEVIIVKKSNELIAMENSK